MLATESARCGKHPELAAVTVCERCGTFACADCASKPGLCRACAEKLQPSALAIATACIGALSFCGLFPLGLVAVGLSFVELARVERGVSAPRSADWARGGRVLGAVAALIGLLVLMVWARV